MRVLVVSCYELGHQPLHAAAPAGALRDAGHEVRVVDLAVQSWDPGAVAWAEAVAFSVPMHTAMRLALVGAEAVPPETPICFFGLYATFGPARAMLIAGEYLDGLRAWVDGGARDKGSVVSLRRSAASPAPDRTLLPTLDGYAHLEVAGERRVAGYVEASRGCAHRCRHCPVPVVYDGRTRKVSVEAVMSDVEAQVGMGARHVTFGDPDFLNRPLHAQAVVRAFHDNFPDLTYDVTAKVEHLLRYAELLPLLRDTGCLFVVSAFETLDDGILRILDKGHTATEAGRVVHLLREHGIEIRPSWLPFTPWTTTESVRDIMRFVVDHDLIGNVDPVQYSIKLLIPPGSLLLEAPELLGYLGGYEPEDLTYSWTYAHAEADALQRRLAAIASEGADRGRSVGDQFFDMWEAAGLAGQIRTGSVEGRPRLTEPWFC